MNRAAKAKILSLIPLLLVAIGLLFASAASASVSCDFVAAPTGSDAGAGTEASPFLTPQRLADALSSGQTGCLRGGTYVFQQTKVAHSGVTLSSYPGERATLIGRFWVAANGVTVSDVNLDGRTSLSNQNGPSVTASDDVFDGVDVTNQHTAICFVLGDPVYGRAFRTVIENSRIHDCGVLPATNQEHGIYVNSSTGAIIRNNWIYDNADRGIQLYPDAQGTQVYQNVLDGNGEGIVFGGDGSTASSNNSVHNNVISESTNRWNVESGWPNGNVGTGNDVTNNCLWATNSSSYYDQQGGVTVEIPTGFSVSGNTVTNPLFVSAASSDFTLQSGSPCASIMGSATTQDPTSTTTSTQTTTTTSAQTTTTTTTSTQQTRVKSNGRKRVVLSKLIRRRWRVGVGVSVRAR